MHKLAGILVSVLFIPFASTAQVPSLAWAKGWGGIPSNEWGSAVAVDAAGAVYTTGSFNGTVDFDPGPATLYLSSIGNGDIFVSKLGASGNLIWVKTFGGPGWDIGATMKLDTAGNIYVAGTFATTADFDPGPGVQNLTSPNSSQDAFLVKLTASGQFAWARHIARGNFEESVYSMALDAQNNIFITGSFAGTPDLDPGPGTAYFASAGGTDVFVSKFDSTGSLKWARKWGDVLDDEANEIALDGAGNFYTTGFFSGTVDFDPSAAVYSITGLMGGAYNRDVFVSKLDTAGNFRWARHLGGNADEAGAALAVSGADVIVGGYFGGSADFNPGTGITMLTSAGNKDVFLTKLDTAGGFVWARSFGGGKTDQCLSLAADAAGNIYVTGWFTGIVDLDPGPGSATVSTSNQDWDMYLSRFDTQGNLVWGVNGGSGPGATEPNFILLAPPGDLYVTGAFTGTADFDPWTGTSNLVTVANPTSNYDIFLAKYSTACPSVSTVVTLTGPTATVATTSGASYQWLACDNNNAPVAGQTNPSFTATVTGNYAVVVHNQLCADTSVCTQVIVCPQLNTTVTAMGGTLAVIPTANATYQWLDCNIGNAPISGQTAQSFTAAVAGDYAVEVRVQTCADTSVCTQMAVAGVEVISSPLSKLLVYPNAFTSAINVSWQESTPSAHISILDALGRTLQDLVVDNATSAHLNTAALSSGVYFLRISIEGASVMKSVTKVER